MAIDLCNKSPGSLAERDPGSWADAVDIARCCWMISATISGMR